MSSVLHQVLERLDAVLQAHVLPGTKVFLERADAESRAEAPSVNVLAQEGEVLSFSDEMDEHQVNVELKFYVRGDPGAVLAEQAHNAVHGPVVSDAQLAALCESRRLQGYAFDRSEGDETITHKSARYRFTYLIPKQAL